MKQEIIKKIASLLFMLTAMSVFVILCLPQTGSDNLSVKLTAALFYLLSMAVYICSYSCKPAGGRRSTVRLSAPLERVYGRVVNVKTFDGLKAIGEKKKSSLMEYLRKDGAAEYYVVDGGCVYRWQRETAEAAACETE